MLPVKGPPAQLCQLQTSKMFSLTGAVVTTLYLVVKGMEVTLALQAEATFRYATM